MRAKIIGTGYYLPELVVTNKEFEEFIETNDEWIQTRTGIKERRFANENTSGLATKAALKAIENAKIDKNSIDLIIVTTFTPDHLSPTVACLVQGNLGITNNCGAYDVNGACSGFAYGLAQAKAFIESGIYQTILLVSAENISKVLDFSDRNSCILFADGAAAVVLQASNEPGIGSVYLKATKDVGESIIVGNGIGLSNQFYQNNEATPAKITIKGQEVFKFATKAIVDGIEQLLIKENLTIDDIDYIIPHQANTRIIDYAIRKLKADPSKFLGNLATTGNTSAASIPLVLAQNDELQKFKPNDKIIVIGFGGGLTWSSALITW